MCHQIKHFLPSFHFWNPGLPYKKCGQLSTKIWNNDQTSGHLVLNFLSTASEIYHPTSCKLSHHWFIRGTAVTWLTWQIIKWTQFQVIKTKYCVLSFQNTKEFSNEKKEEEVFIQYFHLITHGRTSWTFSELIVNTGTSISVHLQDKNVQYDTPVRNKY